MNDIRIILASSSPRRTELLTMIGIPHEEWIETVHAIVILHPGQTADAKAIITHCRERIAHYKCPRSVDIRLEPLPLSAAGKVLKRELRVEYLAKAGKA